MAILILLLFPQLSWLSYFALIVTLHQFLLLFYSIGYIIPIRYLFGSFMCLQMLFGPVMAYNGLDIFQAPSSQMQVTQAEYFSYVIPAVLAFIVGLHIRSNNLKGEVLNLESIKEFITESKEVPYIFIGIGFISGLLTNFLPGDLAFVIYFLDGFKFIGIFMLILGTRSSNILSLSLVLGSIAFAALVQGMFHDLLIWLIFLATVLAIRYQPSVYTKIIFVVGFIILAVSIQLLKSDYREATWEKGEEGGITTLAKTYEQNYSGTTFFNPKTIAESNLRINQGYIITHIMKTVPKKVPFAQGEELNQILVAALLPRFLAPNKLTAGNREVFMKYSRFPIKKGISMGLSSVGDAYINFGVTGGWVFMFILGLLFNQVLKYFHRYSKAFPILLLFTPMVFYYAIRPDSELQTNLGHLVKSCVLIFFIFQFWSSKLKVQIFSRWQRSLS